jgi:hypothetical protein
MARCRRRWTFRDFLDTLTKESRTKCSEKAAQSCGATGDITLQQLLDQKGNPLTLKELEKRYG